MPKEADLRKCFENNPDGAGLMWPENGAVLIRKGFMTWADFKAFALSKNLKNKPVVMHFRITTQGGVQPGLTHPFPVTGEYAEMRQTSARAPMGIAHNGIIRATSDGASDHNDTMRFIRDIAYPVFRSHHWKDADGVLSEVLGQAASGSRLAIMSADGKVTLTGHWSKRADGCMYSNMLPFADELRAQSSDSWRNRISPNWWDD